MPASVSIPRESRRERDDRVAVFFYSFYQDIELLRERGVDARNPQPARLRGWRLSLGASSNLERSVSDSTRGTVFSLTHAELEHLYNYPGVAEYQPRAVLLDTQWGPPIAALCYLLKKTGRRR